MQLTSAIVLVAGQTSSSRVEQLVKASPDPQEHVRILAVRKEAVFDAGFDEAVAALFASHAVSPIVAYIIFHVVQSPTEKEASLWDHKVPALQPRPFKLLLALRPYHCRSMASGLDRQLSARRPARSSTCFTGRVPPDWAPDARGLHVVASPVEPLEGRFSLSDEGELGQRVPHSGWEASPAAPSSSQSDGFFAPSFVGSSRRPNAGDIGPPSVSTAGGGIAVGLVRSNVGEVLEEAFRSNPSRD